MNVASISSSIDDFIHIELFGDSIMCGRDPDSLAPRCGVCNNEDTITARVPEPPAQLLTRLLPQYKLIITTRSQGNSTSGDLLNGTDGVNEAWPDAIEANIVVINHGLNDAKFGIPVLEYKNNLIALRQGLRADQKMIWQTPIFNYYWNTEPYAIAMRQVAAIYGDLIADAYELNSVWVGSMPDGIHPRQLGYLNIVDICLSPKVNAAILKHIGTTPAPYKWYRKDHQEKFYLDGEKEIKLSFTPLSYRWLELYLRDNVSYRAVSRGLRDTNGILQAGVYNSKTDTKLVATTDTYNLSKIFRETGKLVYNKNFNLSVDPNEAKKLAATLNATSDQYIVIITTFNDPKINRLDPLLIQAMYRCGASEEIFESTLFKIRSSYILVGIPGCGKGNGIEAYGGCNDATDQNTILHNNNVGIVGTNHRERANQYQIVTTTTPNWSTLLNTYSVWESNISGIFENTYTIKTGILDGGSTSGVASGTLTITTLGPLLQLEVNSAADNLIDLIEPTATVTISNNVTFAVPPNRSEMAIKFGTNNTVGFVTVDSSPKINLSFNPTGSYTIQTWVHRTSTKGGVIASKNNEYEIYIEANGKISVAIDWGINAIDEFWYYSTATIYPNVNTFLSVVIENGTTLRVYIDGVLIDTISDIVRTSEASANPLIIGNKKLDATTQFSGYLTHFSIWNVAKTSGDITNDMITTPAESIWTNIEFNNGIIPLIKNLTPVTGAASTEDIVLVGYNVTAADLLKFGITTPINQMRIVESGDYIPWACEFNAEYYFRIGYWIWDVALGVTLPLTETLYHHIYSTSGRNSDSQVGTLVVPDTFTSTSILVFAVGDQLTGMDSVNFTIENITSSLKWNYKYYEWDLFIPKADTYVFSISADSTANLQLQSSSGISGQARNIEIIKTVGSPNDQYSTVNSTAYYIDNCGWYKIKIFAADYNRLIKSKEYYPATKVSNSNWNTLITEYGVWDGNGDYIWEVIIPRSETYTFEFSADGIGSLYIKNKNNLSSDFELIVETNQTEISDNYQNAFISSSFMEASIWIIKITASNIIAQAGIGAVIKDASGNRIWATSSVKEIEYKINGVAATVTNPAGAIIWNTRGVNNLKMIDDFAQMDVCSSYNSYCEINFEIAADGTPFAVDIFPPIPKALDITGNLVPLINPTFYNIVGNVPPVNGTRILNYHYATEKTSAMPFETFNITFDNKIIFKKEVYGIVTVICDTSPDVSVNATVIDIDNIQNYDTFTQRFTRGRWAPGSPDAPTYAKVTNNPVVVDATDTKAINLYNSFLNVRVGVGKYSEPIVISQPQHGYVRITSDRKKFAYVPFPDYEGLDSFTYTLMTQTGQIGPPKCVYINVIGAITYTYDLDVNIFDGDII